MAMVRPPGGTRPRLLEAAVGLMAEGGWFAVTSEGVAERAEANEALVTYYFGTLDNLRRAAIAHTLESELEAPVLAILQAENALDGLVVAIAGLAAEGPSVGQRVLVESMSQGLRDNDLRAQTAAQFQTFRNLLADRLSEDQACGLVRADATPVALADLFAALIDGLLLHRLADPQFDAARPAIALAELLRRGPCAVNGDFRDDHRPTGHYAGSLMGS